MLWFLGLALTPCAFSRSSAEISFHGITPLLSPALTSFHKSMCTPSLLPSGFLISPSVLAPLVHPFPCLLSPPHPSAWSRHPLVEMPGEPVQGDDLAEKQPFPQLYLLVFNPFQLPDPHCFRKFLLPSRNTCGAQGLSPLHGVNAMLMY